MKRLAQALSLLAVAAVPAYAGQVMVTPEPSSMVLLATGVGLVGAGAWWRNRRR
jgi:PEP-CTERM putative exosortase interaction domain